MKDVLLMKCSVLVGCWTGVICFLHVQKFVLDFHVRPYLFPLHLHHPWWRKQIPASPPGLTWSWSVKQQCDNWQWNGSTFLLVPSRHSGSGSTWFAHSLLVGLLKEEQCWSMDLTQIWTFQWLIPAVLFGQISFAPENTKDHFFGYRHCILMKINHQICLFFCFVIAIVFWWR